MYRHQIAPAVFLLLALTAGNALAVCKKASSPYKEVVREDVTTSRGTQFKGVVYKCLHLGGYQVLDFDRVDGFTVFDSKGRRLERVPASADFVEALEKLIIAVRKERGRLDWVSIEVDTVEDTWSEIRVAVKQAALSGKGPLRGKDPGMTDALRNAIRQSHLVKATCKMVRRHGLACDPRGTYLEAIAFQHQYIGRDRKQIARAGDAGLYPHLGFSILFMETSEH